MAEVQIQKIQPEAERVLRLSQQVDALYDEVGRRAFRLFQSRGDRHGHDREDWLAAERSLIFSPPAELVEEDEQFEIRMAVPGFEPHQVRVSVLPDEIIVDGDSAATSEQREHQVHFSEFNDRKLLRRVALPQGVRPYTAKASLKNGILRIEIRKAAHSNGRAEENAGTMDAQIAGRPENGSHPAQVLAWRPDRRPEIRFSALETVRIARLHMRIPGRRIPAR
jgi:HSP20 family molecular chaperone IbpA